MGCFDHFFFFFEGVKARLNEVNISTQHITTLLSKHAGQVCHKRAEEWLDE